VSTLAPYVVLAVFMAVSGYAAVMTVISWLRMRAGNAKQWPFWFWYWLVETVCNAVIAGLLIHRPSAVRAFDADTLAALAVSIAVAVLLTVAIPRNEQAGTDPVDRHFGQ
jgi:hypothetical protein